MEKYCLYCNKKLTTNQRHNIFCSISCSNEYKKQNNIKKWLNGEISGNCQNGQLSLFVRKYLLEKYNYKCQLCGWGEINPTTKKVPLEIHHIDGNYLNNRPENLQVLCPNCHSLTSNFKALNVSQRKRKQTRKNYCVDCGQPITAGATRCRSCAGKQNITKKPITREELKELIYTLPFTTIGKRFGVTDNAIRKWCIQYDLPSKKREIKQYNKEEWEKI